MIYNITLWTGSLQEARDDGWSNWDFGANWSMVGAVVGSSVMGSVMWREGGHTVVLDVSNVASMAVVVSSVGHNLDTTIGKVDPVLASHQLAIGHLVLAEVGAGVIVKDSILVGVWSGGYVMHGAVVGSMMGSVSKGWSRKRSRSNWTGSKRQLAINRGGNGNTNDH